MIKSVSVWAIRCALVLLVVGCNRNSPSPGLPIPNYAALKPDQLSLKQADLELAGTNYKADIVQKRNGADLQIDLTAEGQTIESERYRSDDRSFSVTDAGGERFEPPITLIKYPMSVGDGWTWTGNLLTGPEPHKATATVSTSTVDQTLIGGVVHGVVKIQVDLAIDSGRPSEPSKRKLVFYIAPNMGVVRREFGDYSTRKPLEQ